MKQRIRTCAALAIVVLAPIACGDWPETSVRVPDGPWPSLVPLSGLDVTSGATAQEAESQSLIRAGQGLGARASGLRRPATLPGRAEGLSARAAILRGDAGTDAAREAMRAQLATLPGA